MMKKILIYVLLILAACSSPRSVKEADTAAAYIKDEVVFCCT
jgi:uncharacterized lipoprotein YmbA